MPKVPEMKIAITGNIGSGKTEVLNIIKSKGYECYSADEINRELLKKKSIQKKIVALLNLDSFSIAEIARIVFSDESKRKDLEGLLHPLILREIEKIATKSELIFVEVPLLYEVGWQDHFDAVVLCSVSKETAISRLMSQRNFEYQEAVDRYDSQLSNEEKITKADYIIDNEKDYQHLFNQVVTLLEENF